MIFYSLGKLMDDLEQRYEDYRKKASVKVDGNDIDAVRLSLGEFWVCKTDEEIREIQQDLKNMAVMIAAMLIKKNHKQNV